MNDKFLSTPSYVKIIIEDVKVEHATFFINFVRGQISHNQYENIDELFIINSRFIVVDNTNINNMLLLHIRNCTIDSTNFQIREFQSSEKKRLGYKQSGVKVIDSVFMKSHLDIKKVTGLKMENCTFLGSGSISILGVTSFPYYTTCHIEQNRFTQQMIQVQDISEVHIHQCRFHSSDMKLFGKEDQPQYNHNVERSNIMSKLCLTSDYLTNTGLEIYGIEKVTVKNSMIETDVNHHIIIDGKTDGGKDNQKEDTLSKCKENKGTQRKSKRNLTDKRLFKEEREYTRANIDDTGRAEVNTTGDVSKIDETELMKGMTDVALKNNTIKNVDLTVRGTTKLKLNLCKFTGLSLKVDGLKVFQELNLTTKIDIEKCIIDDRATEASQTSKVCISTKTGFLSFKQVKLDVIKSNFTMNCIAKDGFIEWEHIKENITDHSHLKVIQSIFSAPNVKATILLISIPYSQDDYEFRDVTFICRFTLGFDTLDIRFIFQCKSNCKLGQYRRKSISNEHEPSRLIAQKQRHNKIHLYGTNPACPLCPVGATCGINGILPLPDYWGYRDMNGYVTMTRCPKDYCCAGINDCLSIDSCRPGRTGIFCARCETNTTESLFSPNCVATINCQPVLVSIIYILAAVMYAIFLTIFNDVKKLFFKKAKVALKYLKCKKKEQKNNDNKSWNGIESPDERIGNIKEISPLVDSLLLHMHVNKISCTKENSQIVDSLLLHNYSMECSGVVSLQLKLTKANFVHYSPSVDNGHNRSESISVDFLPSDNNFKPVKQSSTSKKEDKEEDNGMKYLQIIFYYVQDASLFKVHLPVIGTSSESWLIHFLQFSPEVLLIYTNITEMCFMENTTATMKVLFTTLFGPFVMLILFLIYLFSNVWDKCHNSDVFMTRLCQAFLLVVLLSYQKLMQGAFTLVQCVHFGNSSVLYIDANVTCFTWWQTASEVILGTCVIPVFLVLAFGPFLVKNKKISVALFIIACILPLPVAICFVIHKMLTKKLSVKKFFWGQDSHSKNIDDGIDDDFDDEYSYSNYGSGSISISDKIEDSETQKIITEHLLKHYKAVKICGVSMTWLGIHKLYRMCLIWCHTYIMELLPRLSAMSILTIFVTFITIFVKPYKEIIANTVAILSHAASICISVINIVKSTLIVGVYEPNELVTTMVKYFDICETILLTWIPVVSMVLWLIYTIYSKVKVKVKDKKPV